MANIHETPSGEEIRTCQGCLRRLVCHKGIWKCPECGKDKVEHPLPHLEECKHVYSGDSKMSEPELINRRWYINGKFISGWKFGNYCRAIRCKPSELTKAQVTTFLESVSEDSIAKLPDLNWS